MCDLPDYLLVLHFSKLRELDAGAHRRDNLTFAWDRALGTLNESEPFWWKSDREVKKIE